MRLRLRLPLRAPLRGLGLGTGKSGWALGRSGRYRASATGIGGGGVVFHENAREESVAAPDNLGIPVVQAVGQALHLRVSASEKLTATRQLVSRDSRTPLL